MNKDIIKSMFQDIPLEYRQLLGKTLRVELKDCLEALTTELTLHGEEKITPPLKNVFACFRPMKKPRIVIVGQDPFIRPHQATGYSFSIPKINPETNKPFTIPPSTKNIYKCLLANKLIDEIPSHGNLENWANQGVLLLNTGLTTRIGTSNAHIFWHKFTDKLLTNLEQSNPDGLIYILLGNFAKSKAKLVTNPNSKILSWGHPSPMSPDNKSIDNPRHFTHCDCFTQANELLRERGQPPINWNPDATSIPIMPSKVEKDDKKGKDKKDDKKGKAKAVSSTRSLDKVPIISAMEERFNESVDPFLKFHGDDAPCFNADIYLFTDGGAKNNRQPSICTAGWGYYLTGVNKQNERIVSQCKYGGVARVKESNGKAVHPSNQRAELMAIDKGLSAMLELLDKLSEKYTPVLISRIKFTIVSDSQYSCNIINEWWDSWVRRNMLDGKKNLDIIRVMMAKVDKLRSRVIFVTRHVRSHKKEPFGGTLQWFLWYGNDIADKLATQGIGMD